MRTVQLLAVSTVINIIAAGAFAGEGTQTVTGLMKSKGYGKLAVAETDDTTVIFGRKGNAFGLVVLDQDTGEVIGQGKWQAGKMTGTEIVPARAQG